VRRDVSHNDVDIIWDRLPVIEDLARYGRGGSRGPKGRGSVSDPTAQQATRGGRDREFLDRAKKTLKELSGTAAEAQSLAPAPPALPHCGKCGKVIDGKPAKSDGGSFHWACYRSRRS
jgi:hypothetical protein